MTRMQSGVLGFDGGALAWESAGEGPGVVFLHPGLWDRRVWDEQFGVFSRTYRVLRFDFRGYGRSSRPDSGRPYSHVEDLAAVMDAAGAERAALVGNWMGGRVAVDFALANPAGVSALVLATPAVSGFEAPGMRRPRGRRRSPTWSARSRMPSRRATSKRLRTCG